MRLALSEAYKGAKKGEGGPFGAVIVRGAKVIARAHNKVLKSKDPTQHAEMRAISMASRKLGRYDLSDCEIYSTTESCPMCFSAIHWARIKRLTFGTRIQDVWKIGFNEMPIPARKMKSLGRTPMLVEGSFLRQECLELLRYWNSLPGKKVY
jgi:guanine deaminase